MKDIRLIAAAMGVAAAIVAPGALADPVALKDVCKNGGHQVVFDANGQGNEQGFSIEIDGYTIGG